MTPIINLKPNDYYSQRNNKWDDPLTSIKEAFIACAPTSRAMFYRGNKIEFTNPTDLEDDDYFMRELRTPEAWDFAREKYPALVAGGFYPNEIHGMYHSYLDPLVCGHRVSDFIPSGITWDKIHYLIEKGRVIMTSGKLPESKIAGHVFCFIGKMDDGRLLVADPYGNPWTGYKDKNGYAIPYTREQFDKYVNHWGHVLLEDVKELEKL